MTDWPNTIPFDLDSELVAVFPSEWERALLSWASHYDLRLDEPWFASLRRSMAELDNRRTAPSNQDRWGDIKEWLERYDVPAPDNLPPWPEIQGRGR